MNPRKVNNCLEIIAMVPFFVSCGIGAYAVLNPHDEEVDLLEHVGEYCQKYDGDNPEFALNYLEHTLQLAGRNGSLHKVKILQEQFNKSRTKIRKNDFGSKYTLVHKVGESMADISDYHRDENDPWYWIVGLQAFSTLTFIAQHYARREDDGD